MIFSEPLTRGQRMTECSTPTDIESAIYSIPADDRETWVRVGMAVKAALGDGGWSIWNDWSQSSDRYDPRAARDVWRSIRNDGGVTEATLFKFARDHGWRPDKPLRIPRSTPPSTPPAPQPSRSTGDYFRSLWGRVCRDDRVVAGHPYCQSKGITHAAGAGRGRVSGKLVGRDADCVVIPIRDLAGKLVAVECINDQAAKQAFGRKSQGGLILGNDLDRTIPWYVAEGWATGVSVVFHHHRGNACCGVAFGKSNMDTLADAIEAAYKPHTLNILQEVDSD